MKMIMIYDQVFQIVFANSNNLQHYIQHILQFCHKTDWVRVPILSDPRDASWKEMKEIMVTNDRAIWGKCPNFPKGLSFPRGHRWLPLKLWLLNLTKRTNLELWLFLTIPISSSGWWGNVLCKLGVTRPLTSEFRLLQKYQKYFLLCWFGSKLIEYNQILTIPISFIVLYHLFSWGKAKW